MAEDSPTLFGESGAPSAGHGLVENGYRESVRIAKESNLIEPIDSGLAALAITLGAAIDHAMRSGKTARIASLATELRGASTQLGMDPSVRGGGSDALSALLAELGEAGGADVGHATQP